MSTNVKYSTSSISKEDKQAYNKNYYMNNKEMFKPNSRQQNKQLIACTCGLVVIQKNLKRHQQSKQHLTRLNTPGMH